MKCRIESPVGAYDAGPDWVLSLKSLMWRFQDVVSEHSKGSGAGLEQLLDQGRAWVLHRLCLHIHQMPALGETLTVVTWHKGEKSYKAFRDFEVWSGVRKRVSAQSLWLFMDLNRGRILKVPKQTGQWYTVETDNALDEDLDTFRPVPAAPLPELEVMTIRQSDIDPIGHVNNAVYLDFLETAVDRLFPTPTRLRRVMIQFHREISQETDAVQVGIRDAGNGFEFTLASDAGIHAFGEFSVSG